MSAADSLCVEDKEFLAQCEEEFKDRFTEKDEEFMKVFNAEPSVPPIVSPWWVSQNSGRRNDRRNNRRNHPYERCGNRSDRYGIGISGNRDNYDQRDPERSDYHERRGYNEYGDRSHSYRNQRPRHY